MKKSEKKTYFTTETATPAMGYTKKYEYLRIE